MKVTIVLLTYNHEKFIVQALEGVLNQETDFDYDITIIEDFSPDKTREIVKDYARKHPDKIKLRLPDYNRNDNLEWMKAIDSAEGEYIALLDGDDYWTSPHKLQKQVDFMDSHPECASCFHPTTHFYEEGGRAAYQSKPPGERDFYFLEDLFLGNFIPTCAVMFRSHLFGELPPWFNDLYAGDKPIHILNAQYGKIGYINEVMGATRIHKGGIWNGIKKIRQFKNLINDYSIMRANLAAMNNAVIADQISKCYFDWAVEAANEGNPKEARRPIIRSIIESPFHAEISNMDRIKLFIKVYTPGLNTLINYLRNKTSIHAN